jgi:hypothetical protein
MQKKAEIKGWGVILKSKERNKKENYFLSTPLFSLFLYYYIKVIELAVYIGKSGHAVFHAAFMQQKTA